MIVVHNTTAIIISNMSDTWAEIQAVKTKNASFREKLAKRKQERQTILAEVINDDSESTKSAEKSTVLACGTSDSHKSISSGSSEAVEKSERKILSELDKVKIENSLLSALDDVELEFPIDSDTLSHRVYHSTKIQHPLAVVIDILQKFEAQLLIVTKSSTNKNGDPSLLVLSANHEKITLFTQATKMPQRISKTRGGSPAAKQPRTEAKVAELNIETLLASETAKEKESKKMSEEIQELLSAASTKEQMMVQKFRSQGGALREFCAHGTRADCNQVTENCQKVHFRKLIHEHTDMSLGDCSFLNTCFHMDTCKYVHYEVDQEDLNRVKRANMSVAVSSLRKPDMSDFKMMPPQWIQCDMRTFDMTVLGKFAVVMADPPWDIHMELPYGTMSDDEMRSLNIPCLQDDGYIFLWVTGRAMELGRECLELWGYRRCDELIWVKTNQLQKLIRTGRTGHWINHGKEHCLIGVKGNPQHMNRGLDCDVIVAEVRATSHKPDEVYGIIERLSPGTRKIELFGRPHNVQPNWITLGNQLDGVQLHEEDVKKNFKKRYPEGNCMEPSKK